MNNLKQIGLALMNYESGLGSLPPAGQGSNYALSPPQNQYIDGAYSVFPRILQYIEGGNTFNAINFNLDYNDLSGSNVTACSQVVSTFLCPSATRASGNSGKDGAGSDPNGNNPIEGTFGGYGVTDYARRSTPTSTPTAPRAAWARRRSSRIATSSRADGLLKTGFTRLSECVDGLSNTIAVAECAGRDAFFVSNYAENYWGGGTVSRSTYPASRNVPGYSVAGRRFWRWAEPHCSLGPSGAIDNRSSPEKEQAQFSVAPGVLGTAGNKARNNQALYSFHPGGINAVFGDGSVRFLKDSTNVVVLRKIITLAGGEVVGASEY